MEESSEEQGSEDQAESWEKFYREQKRPWRGIGKISLDLEPGSKVLDVGCGTGKSTAALIKMGMDATGLDFSPTAINQCIKDYGDKAKFTIAECDHMPFPNNYFAAVTA
ncbi:MAG: methyltransferase domain-containing protein, partial [Methanomassiliicoccaceae archaeon]|nr:methyltransferase domain-containing protein [Methanomassiliicoccaceae archaeon]